MQRTSREKERKLELHIQQLKAELKTAKEEIERLTLELERRPVPRHDIPSESDPAGSYHVHGSTTLAHHQDHHEDDDDEGKAFTRTQMDIYINKTPSTNGEIHLISGAQVGELEPANPPSLSRANTKNHVEHASACPPLQQERSILVQEPNLTAKLNSTSASAANTLPTQQNLVPAPVVRSNSSVAALPPVAAAVESSPPPAPVKPSKRNREAAALEAELRKHEVRKSNSKSFGVYWNSFE